MERNNNESQIGGFWFGYIDVMAMLASIFLIALLMKNLDAIKFNNAREQAFNKLKDLGAEPKDEYMKGGWEISIADSILFGTDQVEVLPTGRRFIDSVSVILGDLLSNPKIEESMRIIVGGHADTSGSDSYNLFLTDIRANNVAAVLQSKLISLNVKYAVIEAIGFGKKEPKNNLSDSRRITIIISPIAIEHIKNRTYINKTFYNMSQSKYKAISHNVR